MILIIDDDSAVRSSLSFMLKRAGYEAQTVSGPREAMEVVRSVAPDLILMDMNFTLSTTGEEGLTLLSENIPSGNSGDTDDRLGKHTACRARYAGRSLRFYHQTLE